MGMETGPFDGSTVTDVEKAVNVHISPIEYDFMHISKSHIWDCYQWAMRT
jgi:hypothetical protein